MTDPQRVAAGLRPAPILGGVAVGVGLVAVAGSLLSGPPAPAPRPVPPITVASPSDLPVPPPVAAPSEVAPSASPSVADPSPAAPVPAATVTATPTPTRTSTTRTPSPTRTTTTETTPTRARTATPSPTRPTESTPTRTPTPTASASPTASPTPTRPPAPRYPTVNGFRECARSGAGPFAAVGTGNASTSCEFAINVWYAYATAQLDGRSGTLTATSPTTKQTYQVSCTGEQPAVCVGGRNGRVLIYGGRLV